VLDALDLLSVVLFALEYAARFWAAAEMPIEGSTLYRPRGLFGRPRPYWT